MSSSRDLISLIGVPGISLAISTACATYSLRARRPKPPPRKVLYTSHLSAGRPDACDGGAERRFAVLRAGPDLALVGRVERGGVHRLHGRRGSGTDRSRPPRPSSPRRRSRPSTSPCLLPTKLRLGVEPGLEPFGDRRARDLGVLALVPDDRQRVERGLGLPPGVGDHRDGGIAGLHDLLHARHAGDLGGVEALELAAEHRALLDRRAQHSGHLEVDGVLHACRSTLSAVSSRFSGLPAIFQSFGSLSLTASSGGSSLAAASATLP